MKRQLALIAALALPLAASVGCDSSGAPTEERAALFELDGQPIYDLDDVPEYAWPLVELIEDVMNEDAAGTPDGVSLRAACSVDCGRTSFSVSGDSCQCHDGVGCAWTYDGRTVGLSCSGQYYDGDDIE